MNEKADSYQLFQKTITQNTDPSLSSPEASTHWLVRRDWERKPKQILQIIRISQYTEVKSEKILKKSKDLQGFHWYILRYPHNMNHTMHILVTYFKNRIPNKYRPLLSSKMRKHTTCITFCSQYKYIENYK